ncbi:hypothetical protein [Agrobacterium tumefaciens]|uniref:hypothetical protein n=1 Tax=Agrobacterium tumefaciens TaxID=358 RepID=UPI0015726D1A|nr:hypothetical protein [Agrobacterium tumefaciens]
MIQNLHPDFRPHAQALLEILAYAKANNPEPEALVEWIGQDESRHHSWMWADSMLKLNRVMALGGSAFAVPFLDPDVCEGLVDHSVELGVQHGHRPNLEENPAYQIPEIVVKHVAPSLHDLLAHWGDFLNIWFMLIWQCEPSHISSIQFAKYEPNGTAHGNWHHDQDSPFTAVVSLAPELFEGGGTDIRLTATEYCSIPPLPPGYALILNGQQLMHRGRAVTSGVRHLLVYWLSHCAPSVSISQTSSVE